MPTSLGSNGLFDERFEWNEYAVGDGRILQEIVLEHLQRHDDEFQVKHYDDALTFSFPDRTGPQNRYRIDADGTIHSGYATDESGTADDTRKLHHRHETITTHRLNALVGRANKTQELVEYIRDFEPFDVEETVFRRYCESPVLSGTDLEKTITQQHGGSKRDEINSANQYLFNRAGTADIRTDEQYEQAVETIVTDTPYNTGLPEAAKIDYELCTKGRDMMDWYDATDADARKSARRTQRTIMRIAAEHLEMEPIYEDVMQENWLVHGNWPW